MKMDIEGAEILVLKGGQNFLAKFRPIIYGEFNSLYIEKFGYNFLDVASLFESLDYVGYQMKHGRFEPAKNEIGTVDVVFVPKEKKDQVKEYIS